MADRDCNLDYPGIDMLNRLSVAYPPRDAGLMCSSPYRF